MMENTYGRIEYGRKKTSSDTIILLFVIVDLLMLPYIRALHCGLGMIVVALWSLLHLKRISRITLTAVFFAIASNVVGMTFFDIGTNGVTSAIMMIYFFFLYDYITAAPKEQLHAVQYILLIYIVFNAILAVVYIVNPQQYFSLRGLWTMSGEEIDFTELEISRFTGIFSDPNNAGCALTLVLAYFLTYETPKRMHLIAMLSIVFLCVLLTFSVTATLMYALTLVVALIYGKATRSQLVNRNVLMAFGIMAVVFLVGYLALSGGALSDNEFIRTLQKRIERNTDNFMGGRLEIWEHLITTVSPFNFVLFGRGLVLDQYNRTYRPHNGILYLLYAYGLPFAVLFCKKFFSINKDKIIFSLPTLLVLVTIFVNTGFSDYRFMTISTLILAISATNYKFLKDENTRKSSAQ